MKNLILFLFVLLMIQGIYAETTIAPTTIRTYKAYDTVDIKIPCVNYATGFGNYCSATAVCNITLIYPNGNDFVKNKQMTYSPSYFNYTLPSSDTMGVYTGSISCNDNGVTGINPDITFQITSTGNTSNFSFFLILGIITLICFILALWSGNEYIMFISSALIMVTGVYGMIYGIGNLRDSFTRIISLVIIALGILFLIISSLKAIEEVSEENAIGGWGAGGDEYDYYKD
jgi:hypothetical protein